MEESRLTEPEIDAALQLIQLSGDSDSGGGYAKRARSRRDDYCGEESVGDTAETICSSSAFAVNINVVIGTMEEDENLEEAELQGWLSRKRKFRSVVELYRVTSPVAIKRSKKANKK